ncbi:hypothetical protein GUJ93_ZPchr0008g13475 [Zizania palustris]|uniref:Plant heme peroxidase family profile domain-containing protein n=1 Tax=Zizania palustris TaxID=103762 RepID=A0A8J5V0T4_ZIZPA|nr:hypothetical protein GUJ93_ZPchr0008g13475 [Zizania palustris]
MQGRGHVQAAPQRRGRCVAGAGSGTGMGGASPTQQHRHRQRHRQWTRVLSGATGNQPVSMHTQGCDASVLLITNGTAERDAPPNFPSLRGFEVIDAAKAAIEQSCPQTVSCADILAFAARDSVNITGDIFYEVPAGRRDGNISIDTDTFTNLPSPNSTAAELIGNFTLKNLTAEEMIILSGAHTIGRSNCTRIQLILLFMTCPRIDSI